MPRLSLIVITENEEAAIGRCIRSVSFADEVIILDSGSTDKTVEIARSLGAIVIETGTFPGQGPQKNRGIDAATGERFGAVDHVVPSGQALAFALERARLLAEAGPLPLALTKALLAEGLDEALARERDMQSTLFLTADHAEGRDAFLQKRRPRFRGL